MGDPEAETHRWVVVAPYTSTHPLPPGYTHLQASTGDIIVPSGQTEDWFIGYISGSILNPENCCLEQVDGIIPKSYVRKVARNIDPVSEKTKDLIRNIYSKRKRLWLDGKYDPRKQSRNKRRITDELDEQTSKMCELHRFRVNCFNKLCTSALRENQKEIVNKANEISKTTHESFIVDENLNNILDTNKPITEILDFYREPILNIAAEKKTKDDEDLFYVASLDKIERA